MEGLAHLAVVRFEWRMDCIGHGVSRVLSASRRREGTHLEDDL